jgi:hypothetical protein
LRQTEEGYFVASGRPTQGISIDQRRHRGAA